MTKWSEALVKNRIDPAVFTEVGKVTPAERAGINDLKFYCEGVIETPERVKKVRNLLQKKAKEKSVLPRVSQIAKAVLEELEEIESDLKFAASRHGKFVLFANDWAQQVYLTLRKDARFQNILIGSAPDKEALVVQGSVVAASDLMDAVQLIAKNEPGVPVEFRITLLPA